MPDTATNEAKTHTYSKSGDISQIMYLDKI
jgi:hypothetical protein